MAIPAEVLSLQELQMLNEVFDITRKRYDRRGECKKCGQCCVNENCNHLAVADNGMICMIHEDPERPQKCTEFPANPPILFKGCGYGFIDTWEDNRMVEQGKT